MAAVGLLVLALAVLTRGMGFSTTTTPSSLEARLSYAARGWLMPPEDRDRVNPVAPAKDVIESGMAHWSDHCATCHANNGSGETPIGRSLYPPAPDMRSGRTQQLSDGELFYVIERGIPLTGMPAWGTGSIDGERLSWELVRFIRHLPVLTESELARMEQLNPKSAAQLASEQRTRDFLKGGR